MAEPSLSDNQKIKVDKLKTEADGFFVRKQYKKAYFKYSEAIKLDGKNAVLYANRAASALSMKEYLDASSDAKEAVNLDPTYAKAWARLGKAAHALGSYNQSISAFEKALSLLPPELSATEKTLKKQCEEGLESVRETINTLRKQEDDSFRRVPADQVKVDELPWNRAFAMMDQLVLTDNRNSSAWVIGNAHRDFKEGVDTMHLTTSLTICGDIRYQGKPTALSGMCNGLLRDPRAFHMKDPKTWIEMYDRQVTFENTVRNGWPQGGARKVKKEALERLRSSGWDALRPALRITICGWFMRAFMSASTNQHVTAVELYSRAVEILQWGQQEWKDVPSDDKGSIFEPTYIRGVKRFYMNALMEACGSHGKSNSEFKLEDAAELAREVIAEARANPPSPNAQPMYDCGFLLSFWTYPIAEALAVLGYYHMQTGLQFGIEKDEARKHFTEAAKNYLESAETFPYDDEKHPYFLAIAVEAYWRRGTALRVTLPLCDRIRKGLAKSGYIWAAHYERGNSVSINHCLEFQEHWKKRVADGEVTMDYEAKPEGIP